MGISGFSVNRIVLTTIKPLASEILINDEEDLLALKRHGIGVTAAFTSDSGNRWSTEWAAGRELRALGPTGSLYLSA